jgi:hypothetical protein
MTMTTVKPEIDRDRWGRPYVIPKNGGKPVPYTRCTTYVGGIEDTFKLGQWQQRQVAVGLAAHDDLLAAVRTADLDDREALNELCDQAKDRAGAGDSARLGTYMHAVTEAHDRGEDPGTVPPPDLALPRDLDYSADLAAYVTATKDLKPVLIEQITVNDALKVGGTPDRVVKFNGKRYIADLKTGSIEWSVLKIAAQLAMYARSNTYNIETGERGEHGAELHRGIVIHLPVGEARCTLYWIDLVAGWEAVRVCSMIREQRTRTFRQLMSPVPVGPIDPATIPVEPVADGDTLFSTPDDDADALRRTLAWAIDKAETRSRIEGLWRAHASEWSDDLTALAKQRIAALGK